MDEELASERAPGAEQAPDGADALESPVYCIGCGYDLRGRAGGAEDRCPECGIGLDFVTAGPKPIPWEHRQGIGAWRAYWATVILMIRVLLTGTARKQLGAPATYAAAQKFRWITVGLAYLGFALVVIALPPLPPVSVLEVYFGWLAVPLVLVMLAALLVLWSGVPSYALESRRFPGSTRQRLIAMSYYCCAPLGLLGLTALGFVAVVSTQFALPESIGLLLFTGFIAVAIGCVLAYFGILWCLCKCADGRAWIRPIGRFLFSVVLLVLSAGVVFAAIPILSMVVIAFHSLT